MPETNPYEPPQTDLQPSKRPAMNAKDAIRPYVIPGIHLAFAVQLLVLAMTIFNWIASEMSPWGNDIQRYARNSLIAGTVAGVLGLGIIIAAKKRQKPRWVFFEILLIGLLIVCAVARLS